MDKVPRATVQPTGLTGRKWYSFDSAAVSARGADVAEPDDLLDVVDVLLRLIEEEGNGDERRSVQPLVDHIRKVETMLDEARSLYRVGQVHGDRFGLVVRVDPTVHAQAEEVMAAAGTPAEYLRAAWHACYDLHPHNEHAFDKAIEAIEAAARPVIAPANSKATLGTMIADLANKPTKWTTTLGTVDQLRERLQALWSIQPRHGTPDPAQVREVNRQQAVAAVHEAITLVHAFNTGLITRGEP